jgi:hypothetical protein
MLNTTFAENCATLVDGNTICSRSAYWVDEAVSKQMTTAELFAHFQYDAEQHGGAFDTEN